MSLLNCKVLRATVATAAVLFFLGLVLQAPRALFGADLVLLTTFLSGAGLFAMVLSPVLMIAVGVWSLLPGASRSLELCRR